MGEQVRSLAREAIRNLTELVFGKGIHQSQRLIPHVVGDMFSIRRNPHGVTRRERMCRAIDHHFSYTRDDVVHLGRRVRVTARRSNSANRNLRDTHNQLSGWHRVATDEFPPTHAATRGTRPLVLRHVAGASDDRCNALARRTAVSSIARRHGRNARRYYSQGVDLNGARVLVTGASRGIGEAIAREATRRGAKVIGVARSTGVLNGVMQSISGVAYPCDLSVDSERASLIERLEAVHGPIDVLINNAGVDDTKMFAQTSTLDVQRVITLNQIVPIELMRQALPRMQSRNRGHVVNISSLAAAGGFAGMTLYCSSKAGLSGFHRVLRHELKGSYIGMTLVEIGPIPTDMLASVKGLRAAERMFSRLRRLQLLPEVPRERVAEAVCDAVERNTANVCLPKRAKIYPLLVGLPQQIVNLITTNIKR